MDDALGREIAEMAIPLVESPLLERWLGQSTASGAELAKMREYAERGYVVIDLELEGFDQLAARVLANLAPHYPDQDRRVMEGWYFEDAVRQIAVSERVLEHLRLFYQREPIPFQTLNFDAGTEQPAHSDTLHFHCAPRRYMAGAWVALEDIDPRSGPLVVYPGSHKLPDFDMHDFGLSSSPKDYARYESYVREILEARGFKPEIVCPRKGQAILWAANLFHGGSARLDPRLTRHSQVTHYYFEDCLYYFPMSSDPFARRLCMREVIDLRTQRFVHHRYRGQVLDLKDYAETVVYPRPLPRSVGTAAVQPQRERPSDLHADAASRVVELTSLRDALHAKIEQLNADHQKLAEHLYEENRLLSLQLNLTWANLPFRLVHSVRKTLYAWRARRAARRRQAR